MKAVVIVVTAMTVAVARVVAIEMIAATVKIAMVQVTQRNATVATTVAKAVARARKRLLVIVSSATPGRRKALS